ncbi:ribosomal RNA small subunit methyltransferase A [Candidatus Photodesmus katoptron]|uniref:Ribosomal RNA small subunit methyltransferase A n=1 Tax=Candidatus Photodesmus katoptron Akat1 TaxID=1236703 RepID=S3DZD9_9GAMM|nr:16S rRNA (adenine(1518)-N(6)/adenine(1519)-N(6))-dimethyltransferase RsmA [Candidatus Photodesmus katoptron]EPE37271.1 ribosomal RNA adenine dimethylase [Candidatus Photodesmus katoptron Akat1]KEY90072.1 ribosomal RNA small subunit methyltransferase A [Candidatus Photodesmus katoptron]
MKKKIYLGHKAQKRFGQHFLKDPHIIKDIVSLINPKSEENLVEIGPGLGAITEAINQKINSSFTVIELDDSLVQRLRNHPTLSNKLIIYPTDATCFNFARLIKKNKKLRIFGNLPYNISTPLLFHLFKFHTNIQDMHFTLQKEVGDRLTAKPGSKAYGRLTVMVKYYCQQILPLLNIPSTSFFPEPKIDSVFIQLVLHEKSLNSENNLIWLDKLCRNGFNQRRKTIRNCYKELLDIKAFKTLGINPDMRPENLTLEEFIAMANWANLNCKLNN